MTLTLPATRFLRCTCRPDTGKVLRRRDVSLYGRGGKVSIRNFITENIAIYASNRYILEDGICVQRYDSRTADAGRHGGSTSTVLRNGLVSQLTGRSERYSLKW